MPKKVGDEMDWQAHKQKRGAMLLILGILILANAYWSVVGWDIFIGIIIALAGLGKLLMPIK